MKVSMSGLRQDSPSRPLLQALISYQGVTDAAGAASGLTIVCGDLVNEPSYDGQLLKIRSGDAAGQVKPIYVQAGNTLTFATPWTNAAGAVVQIPAGTPFDILSISGGGGGPTPAPREGLSYYGIVDAVPGANQFTIGSLAGLGAGKLDGATNPYYAFVLRDAGGAGAAPQGEQLPITAYVTGTGVFTTAAFTDDIAVGDEILIIHPDIAANIAILAGLSVSGIDGVINLLMRDVIGNKADTALTAYTAVDSMMRYVKGLIDQAATLTTRLSAVRAGYLDELAAANIPADVDNILLDTQIRVIQSGVQAILAAASKWLHIDSGTNGAEILSITIEGLIGHDWTLATYVPAADAVAAPAAVDKRDTIAYLAADTEGGLLKPLGIPFNAYLQFTNNGANDQIDQVTITYRSRGVLTLTWGP